MKGELREGITTGTCAAAATMAACAVLNGEPVPTVTVETPSGPRRVDVLWSRREKDCGVAAVVKDAGDDPDVTHGMSVISRVTPSGDGQFDVDGGEGVGLVTKPGLKVPVGQKAINPVPRAMILSALQAGLPGGGRAVISLPGGEELARKTYNPRLGIVGGLSVLGTRGVVRPMSEEALRATFKADLDVKRALGRQQLVYTFGNMGERFLKDATGLSDGSLVQVGNELGYMLKEAHRAGLRSLLLAGHSGKLVKVAAGVFQTHSSVADARMETMMALAALEGAPVDLLLRIDSCTTTEGIGEVLRDAGGDFASRVWNRAARRAAAKARAYLWGDLPIETCLFDNAGTVLGASEGWDQALKALLEEERGG